MYRVFLNGDLIVFCTDFVHALNLVKAFFTIPSSEHLEIIDESGEIQFLWWGGKTFYLNRAKLKRSVKNENYRNAQV